MLVYHANALFSPFIALIVLSNYSPIISALSWHGPTFRDYEYPELQLLLTAKEETNNSKDEEKDGSKLNFKAVNGEGSNFEQPVDDPLSPGRSSESGSRPWMKPKYVQENKYSPKLPIIKSVKNNVKLHIDNPTQDKEEEEAGEKMTSTSQQEQALTDDENKNRGHITYNEPQKVDESREREQKRSPGDSQKEQKEKSTELSESSNNQHLIKIKKDTNSNKEIYNLQRNTNNIGDQGSKDVKNIDGDDFELVSTSGIELENPGSRLDEIRNSKSNFFYSGQRQFNGRSSKRATGNDAMMIEAESPNHEAAPVASNMDKTGLETRDSYNQDLVEPSQGVYEQVVPLANSEMSSINESKPIMESLSPMLNQPFRNNSFVLIKPTSSNATIPLTYPIPETNNLNAHTPKPYKSHSVSSDIVAHVPIKLLGQTESKAGKSLANNLPLPDQRNPLANIEINIKNQEKQEFKEETKDSETKEVSDLPLHNMIQSATMSSNRMNQPNNIKGSDSSLEQRYPHMENSAEGEAEKHNLLKKSLNMFKRNKFGDGFPLNNGHNSGLQEERFYSLTSNESPSAKLSAFLFKVKDKRNLKNILKHKKMNRTSIGMKRSIGDRDPVYDNYDYYSSPNMKTPSEDYEYEDEDEYGPENKNLRTFSNVELPKRYRPDWKQRRQKDDSDEYYFYVDEPNYLSKNRNYKNRSAITLESKLSDNVFAHPLTIDDPELEIINGNNEIKKTHLHRKVSHLNKRRKIKSEQDLNLNGYKELHFEQDRKVAYPETYIHHKKENDDVLKLKPHFTRKLLNQNEIIMKDNREMSKTNVDSMGM